VGRHLFDKVIGPKGMLKDKTRILVTHRISILPQVDQIIVLKDGVISEYGSYDELLERKGDFAELLAEHLVEETETSNDQKELEIIEKMAQNVKPFLERTISRIRSESGSDTGGSDIIRSRISSVRERTTSESLSTKLERQTSTQRGEILVEEESAETGSVNKKVFWKYIKSMGINSSILVISLFIVSNVFQVCYSLWLSEWSDDSLDPNNRNDTALRDLRLGVYAGLGFGESLTDFMAGILLNLVCLKASKIIHDNMLEHMIKSPMSFFGEYPFSISKDLFSLSRK
jgi:ATP-binding cassette subfamily C (CFTR/MRP) protein 1